ncbi:MAG TPA: hypothetical protein VJ353_12650, partial [Xanthobacteraceae bacterium]|nr:hypothetical protein [Xanthobacteraceae bacterium]
GALAMIRLANARPRCAHAALRLRVNGGASDKMPEPTLAPCRPDSRQAAFMVNPLPMAHSADIMGAAMIAGGRRPSYKNLSSASAKADRFISLIPGSRRRAHPNTA